MEKDTIRTLTSLRFFACILIVIHHMGNQFIPALLQGNSKFAFLGVTFFLMLSGFLIRYNYSPFKNLKESFCFLWNRIVRIYPLHVMTLSVFIIPAIMQGLPVHVRRLAFINVMLLQAYFPLQSIYFSFNTPSWMLSALFFFYLLFSIANLKPYLFRYMAILAITCLLLFVYCIETDPRGQDPSFELWLLYIFPPAILATILLGVLLCSTFKKYHRKCSSRTGILSGTLLEIFSLLLIVDFFWWGYFTQFAQHVIFSLPVNVSRSWNTLIPNYITAPLPLMILILVFALEKGIVSRILQTRVFICLGEMSFSIFMIHIILMNHLIYYLNCA